MELLELRDTLSKLLEEGVPKDTPVKFESDSEEGNQWIEDVVVHPTGSSGYEIEGCIDLISVV
tara:strand:- start:151 stop:339 length:189 start_codon:yes stop_codon:yes gene_type:complete